MLITGTQRTAQSDATLMKRAHHSHKMVDLSDDYKGRLGYVVSGDVSDAVPSGILLDVSLLLNGREKILRTSYDYMVDARYVSCWYASFHGWLTVLRR